MKRYIIFLLWTFTEYTLSNHAHVIWELDFADFCNKTLQWDCVGVSYNQSLLAAECANQQCIFFDAFAPLSSITVSDISTVDRVNVALSYTLTLNATTNYTDTFVIYSIVGSNSSDKEIVAIHGGDIVDEEFIVQLNTSTINQTDVALQFELVGAVDGDAAYLMAAKLYEPSEEGHETGLKYNPVHVYILAGGMAGGALLIVFYFRVCRTRVECCQKRCNLERCCSCGRKKRSLSEMIISRSGTGGGSPVSPEEEKENDGKVEQGTEEKELEKEDKHEDKHKYKNKEKEKDKDKDKDKVKEHKEKEKDKDKDNSKLSKKEKNRDKSKGKEKDDKVTEEDTKIISQESMGIAATEVKPK